MNYISIKIIIVLNRKYKYMERRLTTTKSQLKLKVPEIEKTLDMVVLLKKKTVFLFILFKQESDESVETYYSLADNIYSKATIDKTGTVCIWLGANVMVEYTYDEAISLLHDNLEAATNRLVFIYIFIRKIQMKILDLLEINQLLQKLIWLEYTIMMFVKEEN